MDKDRGPRRDDRRRTYDRDRSRSPRRDRRDDHRRERTPPRGPPPRGAPPRSDRDREPYRAGSRQASGTPPPSRRSDDKRAPPPRKPVDGRPAKDVNRRDNRQDARPAKDTKMQNGFEDEDSETEMLRVMGFKGFKSTKNTKVPGNHKNHGVYKAKTTEYRQYMNRVGGFNRPLSPSRM